MEGSKSTHLTTQHTLPRATADRLCMTRFSPCFRRYMTRETQGAGRPPIGTEHAARAAAASGPARGDVTEGKGSPLGRQGRLTLNQQHYPNSSGHKCQPGHISAWQLDTPMAPGTIQGPNLRHATLRYHSPAVVRLAASAVHLKTAADPSSLSHSRTLSSGEPAWQGSLEGIFSAAMDINTRDMA